MIRAALLALALAATVGNAGAEGRLPVDFVYLRDIDPTIRQDMRYAGHDNFTGSPLAGYSAGECILRRAVAEALKQVQAGLAARNLSLKVYDCYRPARAVRAMARWAQDGKPETTRRFYPGLSKRELFARGYISHASAHSRGVAVDLTLVALKGEAPAPFNRASRYGPCTGPLAERAPDDSHDMGTGYDCFDAKSATRSPAVSAAQAASRQMLRAAMRQQGFVNYHREWWHYSLPRGDGGRAFDFPVTAR